MGYTQAELTEARRQLDSILHKLREAVGTLEERAAGTGRYRSQLTLARRRITALELANTLIEKELTESTGGSYNG